MMFMDPPMATLTQNDGIISLMHCQEWNSKYLTRIEWEIDGFWNH